MHIRRSGKAPQLRIYAVSDSQARADEIVSLAVREPDGVLRQLERKDYFNALVVAQPMEKER